MAGKVSHLSLVHALFGNAFSISRWYIPGHDGIDLAAKEGTPIRAVSDGRVWWAKDARKLSKRDAYAGWAYGGGNVVDIDVGDGKRAQYAHLQTIMVREGQYVKKGQVIGTVGRTGGLHSDGSQGGPGSEFYGPHLHFGIWDVKRVKMIEPTTYLLAAKSGYSGPLPTGTEDNSGKNADDQTRMGGWGVPEGTILTKEVVDEIITRMDKAGLFKTPDSNPVSEAMAIDTTRKLLYSHIGEPWQPSTTGTIQTQLGDAAVQANALGSLAVSVSDIVMKLTDPANWIRILALLAGMAMVAYGVVSIGRATGVSLPVPHPY